MVVPVPVPVPVYLRKLVPVPVPVPVYSQKSVPVSVPVPVLVPVSPINRSHLHITGKTTKYFRAWGGGAEVPFTECYVINIP